MNGRQPVSEGGGATPGGGDTATAAPVPLVVDLDGTLIRSDLAVESLALCLRKAPGAVLRAALALPAGPARLKAVLAEASALDARWLPYRADVLDYVRAQRQRGRPVILATAADRRLAERVAQHLGLFDQVLASDCTANLRGARKLAAIREAVGPTFDYVGNDRSDAAVWAGARRAINAGTVRCIHPALTTLADPCVATRGRALLRALRPHQWTKNLLVFVPLLTSHRVLETAPLVGTVTAFVAFCLASSSVYVGNDLLDMEADRQHATKRRRPLASGELPVLWGLPLAGLLAMLAVVLAGSTAGPLLAVLGAYLALSTAYSLQLKQCPALDVLVLALLYTSRLFAGGAAAGIVISPWLGSLSLFLFTSLALAKRYLEVVDRGGAGDGAAVPGRGYRSEDGPALQAAGVACGVAAVLVVALYVNSPAVQVLYREPRALWLLCPLLLYWVMRVWLLAARGTLHQDPVVFAATDRVSWLVGLGAVALGAAAAAWPVASPAG